MRTLAREARSREARRREAPKKFLGYIQVAPQEFQVGSFQAPRFGSSEVVQEGRNGLIADRYESVAARSPTKLGGIIEGTRAVMENKVRTPGGQIYTLPERWQIEPR